MSEPRSPEEAARDALLASRSFTNPITNRTLFPQAEVEQHLGEFAHGRLPFHWLPTFLHEAAHHFCFFTPVGMALAVLTLRARRRAIALELGEGAGLDPLHVLDDFLRSETSLAALRPLLEGIALFVECDARPGTSPNVSEVLNAAWHYFAPRAEDEEDQVDAPLRRTLDAMRLQESFLRRKTGILVQPMRCDAGGYLPGYLTVKNLWYAVARSNDRLWDSDLYFRYLVAYVFNDLGLVAHLLDPDTSDWGAAGVVVNYIAARLGSFVHGDHDAHLVAIDADQQPLATDDRLPDFVVQLAETPGLGTDHGLARLGRERLLAQLEELTAESDGGTLGGYRDAQRIVLAQRELLSIGRADVDVEISDQNRVRIRHEGQLVLVGPGAESALAGRAGRGSMDVFLNPWRWGRYIALAVSFEGATVLRWFNRAIATAARRQFAAYQTDTLAGEVQDQLVSDFLDHALLADGTNAIIYPAVLENVAAWCDGTYKRYALATAAEAREDDLFELTRDDGFSQILGEMRLVRALAWLSLRSMRYTRPTLDELFAEERDQHRCTGGLDEVVAEIGERTTATWGAPLAVADAQTVMSVV